MSNDRKRLCIARQQKILSLVHNDLAGPIQPLAKDGYWL